MFTSQTKRLELDTCMYRLIQSDQSNEKTTSNMTRHGGAEKWFSNRDPRTEMTARGLLNGPIISVFFIASFSILKLKYDFL